MSASRALRARSRGGRRRNPGLQRDRLARAPRGPRSSGVFRGAQGSAITTVGGASKWWTSAWTPTTATPAASAASAARPSTREKSTRSGERERTRDEERVANASDAARTKTSSTRWNSASKRGRSDESTSCRTFRAPPDGCKRPVGVHGGDELGRHPIFSLGWTGASRTTATVRSFARSTAASRSCCDDRREHDQRRGHAEVTDREVRGAARRGRLREELREQRLSASPMPTPATHSGTSSQPTSFDGRNASAPTPPPTRHAPTTTRVSVVRARSVLPRKPRPGLYHGECGRKGLHRPADDDQQHDPEEQRRQRARDEAEREELP